jgi:hypothetical protein
MARLGKGGYKTRIAGGFLGVWSVRILIDFLKKG